MIPVRQPDSPLERWIAAGVVERAEEPGSVLDVDPYPASSGQPTASKRLRQARENEDGD
jgi:hypothetical protein